MSVRVVLLECAYYDEGGSEEVWRGLERERGLEFLPGGGGPGLLPGGVGTGLLPGDVVRTIQMRLGCDLLTGSVQTGGRRGWPWHLKSADLRSRQDDSLSRLISGIWLSIPETDKTQSW